MSEIIKSVNLKDGNVLEIYQDEYPINPRKEDDGHIGIVAIFHNSYDIGDEDIPFSSDDFKGWDEMEDHIMNKLKAVVCLPIYMYDHSGITIGIKPYSCKFDSGQVGFIYTTLKRLDSLGVNLKEGETWAAYVAGLTLSLEAEIKTLDEYVTGDVYGFQVKNAHGEQVDSCTGFYGNNFETNGILDNISSEPVNLDDL